MPRRDKKGRFVKKSRKKGAKRRAQTAAQVVRGVRSGPYCKVCERRLSKGVPLKTHDLNWHGVNAVVKEMMEKLGQARGALAGLRIARKYGKMRRLPARKRRGRY